MRIVRIRKRSSSTFHWMGWATIGFVVLFTLTCVNSQRAQAPNQNKNQEEDETESPSAVPTTIRQEDSTGAETTDNPGSPYQYDDTEELESVTDDETLIPTTTLKAARNFGNRIRGINSLPNNANSVNLNSLASSNRNLTHHLNSNSNSNNVTSFPFLRPRPTTSSVISYNPTQYNRVIKRKKNSTVSTPLSTLTTAATFTTPSLLTYLSTTSATNTNSNRGRNTSSTISTVNILSNSLNRRSDPDVSNNNNNAAGPTLSTLPTTSSQQIRQTLAALAASRSNSSSSSSSNGLGKLYSRKRPRPITLSDGRGPVSEESPETTFLPTPATTIFPPEDDTDTPDTTSTEDDEDLTSTIPPPMKNHFNRGSRPPFQSSGAGTGRPLIFGSRKIKVKVISPTKSTSIQESEPSPAPTPSSVSVTAAAAAQETETSIKPLVAQPGSNVPVSSVSFEYNPSVSVQDGIYKFKYSDIKPTVSTRRLHSEDFGVSHVTYGHDHDEDETTTSYPPHRDALDEEGTTGNPFNIDIDGSEEEFTSSLPPSYREYFNSDQHQEEEEEQVKKPFLRNAAAAAEGNSNVQQRVRPVMEGGGQVESSSVTVTVTHTITAGGEGGGVEPTRIHQTQNSSENKLAFELGNNQNQTGRSSGTATGFDPNQNRNHNHIAVQEERDSTQTVKDGNSLPNTIPIVVELFNSSNSNAINEQQLQRQEQQSQQSNEENVIRATPALPPVPTQSSTWIRINESSPSIVEVANEISKNVVEGQGQQPTAVASGNGPVNIVETPGNKSFNIPDQIQIPNVHNVNINATSVEVGVEPGPTQSAVQGQIDKVSVSPKNPESEVVNPGNVEITPSVSSKIMTSVFFTKHEDPYYTTRSYSFSSSTEYSFDHPNENGNTEGQHPHDEDQSHYDHEHHDHDHDSGYGHEGDHEGTQYGHEHGHQHSNDSQRQHPIEADNTQKQQELRPTTTSFWDSLGQKSASVQNHTVMSPNNNNGSQKIIPEGHGHDHEHDHHDQDLGYSTPEVDTEYPPFFSVGDFEKTTPMPESNSPDHSEADNEIDDGHLHDGIQNGNANGSSTHGHSHHGNGHGHNHGNRNSSTDDRDGLVLTSPYHPEGNRSRGNEIVKEKGKKHSGGGVYELDPHFPSVPVFIQVLLDMPAVIFCSSVPLFKEMVVKVYASKVEVTKDQVVVFNEPKCRNLTWDSRVNANNQSHQQHSGKIKFATTTASVTRTISSTARTVENQNQRRQSSSYNPVVIVDTTPSSSASPSLSSFDIDLDTSLTKPTTSTNNARVSANRRRKRHDQDSSDGNSIQKKTFDESNNNPNPASEDSSETTVTLYPVFFYLTDKNGSYNQVLTESFVEYWNISKATSNTMFFDKIKKVEMVTPTQEITGHAADNENSGIIAAITIASIAAVGLFLMGVLLLVMRHRQAQSKFAKRCTPVSLDDYSLDNISVYNSFRRKQRKRTSTRSYTNAAFDDPNAPSRPCNAAALTAIIGEPVKIEDEFRALPSVSPTMEDIPAGAEAKNRYANVIPMPDTRVFVTFQEDVPNSDYINANFVRGPMGTPKGYIITQGPLDDTIVDFWRMVWEQQIRVIMMLTDFSEAGIPKCAEYYPRSETVDSSQLHGDFQITLEKRDITENCITSYLVIKDMERSLRRDVIHLWYHSWPEKGVPAQSNLTVDFLTKSRKFTKEPTPVLVHCSPGTGRSGTLVACDVAMREFDSQHNVNIPRTVMKIRQDRAGAVQTKEQYLHIYQVAQYYATRLSGTPLDSV